MARKPNLEARDRILKTAYELMHQRGYEGVSMDQVAAATGLKKANLFHYYPSKERLGAAVFEHASAQLRSRIQAECADCTDPLAAVAAMFDAFAQGMGARGCRGGCFVGNLAQELDERNELLRSKVAEHFRFWAGELEGLFTRSKARGYFKAEFEPRPAAHAVLALLEGATLMAKAGRDVQVYADARKLAVGYLEKMRA
jgi:TetR/AcrR family transcriptional regulator, transcriptional repressor for nem operon